MGNEALDPPRRPIDPGYLWGGPPSAGSLKKALRKSLPAEGPTVDPAENPHSELCLLICFSWRCWSLRYSFGTPPPSDWINWLHNHPSETINSMNDWWNWRQHYSYCIRVDWLTGLINDRILIDLTIDSVSGEVKWLQRDFDIDPLALMYFFSSIEVGGFAMIGNTLWGFSWFALVFQLISDCLNPIIKSFSPAPPMHCQQFN